MGRSTYYAPLYVSLIVALLGRDIYGDSIPPEPAWQHWAAVIGISLGFGIACQLAFMGVQGMFAQVLPVPGGRSIRGRSARISGTALLFGVAGIAISLLMFTEGIVLAASISGAVTLALLLTTIIVYLWSLPAAVSDFDTRDPLV